MRQLLLLSLIALFVGGCITKADKQLFEVHQQLYETNASFSEVTLNFISTTEELAAHTFVLEKMIIDCRHKGYLDSHTDEQGRLYSVDADDHPVGLLRADMDKEEVDFAEQIQTLEQKRSEWNQIQDEYYRKLLEFAAANKTTEETERVIMEAKRKAQNIIQQGLTLVGGIAAGAVVP